MIGIDLFAGAGGLSLGATAAGIDVRVAVEIDPHAARTYQRNHPDVTVVNGDIRSFAPVHIDRARHEVVVFGGPPCRGFSTSNQRTRNRANPSNWLFREFLRVVEEVDPDWVVMENVSGMLQTEDGTFLDTIKEELRTLGFAVQHSVLNAADYGVPQRRSRLFIVGAPPGRVVAFPKKTRKDPITVWEAIGDLPRLRNGASKDWLPYRRDATSAYAKEMRGDLAGCRGHIVTRNADYIIERYRHVRQGGNWEDIPVELMDNYQDRTACHTGIYHRLRSEEPAKVVGNYRKNMLIHPFQQRGLSVREAARLQSFPDWFEFEGSIGFQQQQVGNAVPPLLAKRVFDIVVAA